MITDMQRMQLFRVAREQRVPFRQMKALMEHLTGKRKTDELTEPEYQAVLFAVSFDAEPFDGPVAA